MCAERSFPDNAPITSHSPDFRTVTWFGMQYIFTRVQAAVVRLLWEAWEKGLLGLSLAYIAENIETENRDFRIDHIFRNHCALGTMIQRVRRGHYALVPPPAAQ